MKKLFIRLSVVATMGLALAACGGGDNKKAMEADNAAIDELVNAKLKTLDDSISGACDAQVTAAATAIADSLSKASAPKEGAKKPAAKPAAKPAPKKEEPKKVTGAGGKSDAQQQTGKAGGKSDAQQKAPEARPGGKAN
jgi:hypothetical protein